MLHCSETHWKTAFNKISNHDDCAQSQSCQYLLAQTRQQRVARRRRAASDHHSQAWPWRQARSTVREASRRPCAGHVASEGTAASASQIKLSLSLSLSLSQRTAALTQTAQHGAVALDCPS